MFSWKSLLLMFVSAAVLTGCCCPLGSLLGTAELTTGDFDDVPAYPDARQTTESDMAVNTLVAIVSLISEEEEWKHYISSDPDSAILDWYTDTLPQYGWTPTEFEDIDIEGGLFFVKAAEPDTALYIGIVPDVEGGEDMHIVVGRLKLSVEFQE